jgi:hypothetical protein
LQQVARVLETRQYYPKMSNTHTFFRLFNRPSPVPILVTQIRSVTSYALPSTAGCSIDPCITWASQSETNSKSAKRVVAFTLDIQGFGGRSTSLRLPLVPAGQVRPTTRSCLKRLNPATLLPNHTTLYSLISMYMSCYHHSP